MVVWIVVVAGRTDQPVAKHIASFVAVLMVEAVASHIVVMAGCTYVPAAKETGLGNKEMWLVDERPPPTAYSAEKLGLLADHKEVGCTVAAGHTVAARKTADPDSRSCLRCCGMIG